jgi:hypothetical protein
MFDMKDLACHDDLSLEMRGGNEVLIGVEDPGKVLVSGSCDGDSVDLASRSITRSLAHGKNTKLVLISQVHLTSSILLALYIFFSDSRSEMPE